MATMVDELGNPYPIEQMTDEFGTAIPNSMVNDETPSQPPQPTPATTTAGTAVAKNKKKGIYKQIGKRPFNPLSLYSSYTYQFTLYMITPDALQAFNESGRTNIAPFLITAQGLAPGSGGGAYIIAQSGGINNEYRAPGFEYDYYIDNVKIKTPMTEGGTTTATNMDFTITESYGFSLNLNLKKAKDALDKYSKTIGQEDASNASRQFFIMGVKFLGYDAAGNLITKSPLIDEPDPTFQRYFDLNITEIKFKVDGKNTIYNISAACPSVEMAMGQKRGVIDKGTPQLVGSTVEEILNKLMDKITDDQENAVKNGSRKYPNTYKIEWIGDAQSIAKSSIISTADLDKSKWPMAVPQSKDTVNDNLSIKSQPNNKERIMSFTRDTPIIQAISSVITQSEYLVQGLKVVYDTAEQPDAKTDDIEGEEIDSKKRLKWFHISASLKNAKFDTNIKDYVFDIVYQVRTYDIPYVISSDADKTTPYYGPVKRYEYWWTGKNSEITRYEQTLNNSFFTTVLKAGTDESEQNKGGSQVPIADNKRSNAERLGKLNLGKEAQNTIPAFLSNPGDWAKATIEILGDPDWLTNPTPTGTETAKSFYKPDGFTVDPSAGQVFVEIKFLEGVDYDHDKGTMKINQPLFWDMPADVYDMLEGAVSFVVTTVTHNFSRGKFTQTLELALHDFNNVEGEKLSERMMRESREAALAIAQADAALGELGINTDLPAGGAGDTQDTSQINRSQGPVTGLSQDQPVTTGTSAGGQIEPPIESGTQETTEEGIADDDAELTQYQIQAELEIENSVAATPDELPATSNTNFVLDPTITIPDESPEPEQISYGR